MARLLTGAKYIFSDLSCNTGGMRVPGGPTFKLTVTTRCKHCQRTPKGDIEMKEAMSDKGEKGDLPKIVARRLARKRRVKKGWKNIMKNPEENCLSISRSDFESIQNSKFEPACTRKRAKLLLQVKIHNNLDITPPVTTQSWIQRYFYLDPKLFSKNICGAQKT